MIGHYLLTLDEEAEEAVMTGKLLQGEYEHFTGSRCLVGWAADITFDREEGRYNKGTRRQFECNTQWVPFAGYCGSVETRFDKLCDRFGVKRIANAIRSRILTNQLRRQLAGQAVAV